MSLQEWTYTIASIRHPVRAVSENHTEAGEVKASLVPFLVQALAVEYQKALCLFRLQIFLRQQDAEKSSLKPQPPVQSI